MALPNRTSLDTGWKVTYTQSDVDTIREQIVQDQSAKRRFLMLLLLITAGALAGAIVLLSTSYALYAGSEADKKKLAEENAALKSDLAKYRQELDAYNAENARREQARAAAQTRLDALRSAAEGRGDVASLAQMIYSMPQRRLELDRKPDDKIFRNWKVRTASGTETYTLVGGFVDRLRQRRISLI